MTQTLAQINSNPLYAPLGEEAQFLRRITLENFKKCLTIREFQKTAGRELIKSPSSKPIKELIEKFNIKKSEYPQSYNTKTFFKFWGNARMYPIVYGVKPYDIKDHPEIKKLYTSKTGKKINSRYVRIWELISSFNIHNQKFENDDSEAIRRIGFFKVIDNFKKLINMSGEITDHKEYWDFCDSPFNWINQNNEYQFYYHPFGEVPDWHKKMIDYVNRR